jgi:K+-sensing histidine kinase KdpD
VEIEPQDSHNPVELIIPETRDFASIFPFDNISDFEFISEELSDLNNKFKIQNSSFSNLVTIQKATNLTAQNLKLHQIVKKTLQLCEEIIPFSCGNIIVNRRNKWSAIQRKTKNIFESCFGTLSKDGLIDWMFNKQTYIIIPYNELECDQKIIESGKIICFPMILNSNRVGICMLYLDNDHLSFSLADLEAVKTIISQATIAMKFQEERKKMKQFDEKLTDLKKLFTHFVKMAIVGELAKDITHEINNPLQVILGKIQIAMMGMNNLDLMKSIEKQSLQIALLVRLISDISKGPKRDDTDIIEVNSFIKSNLSLIQNQIEKKGIKINFCSEKKDLKIYCNSAYLQQLILNSIFNAKNRMSRGGELNIKTNINKDDRIQIQFNDTAHKIEDVFEGDFLKNVTKLKKVGDINLVFGDVVNSFLVEEMGGEIQYLNNNPSGNTITFKLPKK